MLSFLLKKLGALSSPPFSSSLSNHFPFGHLYGVESVGRNSVAALPDQENNSVAFLQENSMTGKLLAMSLYFLNVFPNKTRKIERKRERETSK